MFEQLKNLLDSIEEIGASLFWFVAGFAALIGLIFLGNVLTYYFSYIAEYLIDLADYIFG